MKVRELIFFFIFFLLALVEPSFQSVKPPDYMPPATSTCSKNNPVDPTHAPPPPQAAPPEPPKCDCPTPAPAPPAVYEPPPPPPPSAEYAPPPAPAPAPPAVYAPPPAPAPPAVYAPPPAPAPAPAPPAVYAPPENTYNSRSDDTLGTTSIEDDFDDLEESGAILKKIPGVAFLIGLLGITAV
ncbi:hypothetical protein HMI54_006531 [Coelomomyces lativittatus]|nr:hypothetical protein HMI54_006531 [Coelomomyces lativittatus]KAJ1507228.1 hypothetical protein HMI56_000207 [Coelomomyces lativittatus]